MATYLLRPNGDGKAGWTEDPVGPAWSTLDDVVTQPTAPTTGSDRITSAANGDVCTPDFTTATIPAGESVASVTIWVYGITPGTRNFTVQLQQGGTALSALLFTFPISTTGWVSGVSTATGPVSQAIIDGLQVQLQSGSGSGTVEADAVYLEVTTRASSALPILGVG